MTLLEWHKISNLGWDEPQRPPVVALMFRLHICYQALCLSGSQTSLISRMWHVKYYNKVFVINAFWWEIQEIKIKMSLHVRLNVYTRSASETTWRMCSPNTPSKEELLINCSLLCTCFNIIAHQSVSLAPNYQSGYTQAHFTFALEFIWKSTFPTKLQTSIYSVARINGPCPANIGILWFTDTIFMNLTSPPCML